eukprot:11163297-Lingulodinium_polyedra.AAC.1
MQNDIQGQIISKRFNLVFLAPPCSAFSRAFFADRSYPQPARDFAHPFGLPNLGVQDRKKVAEANDL